MGLDWMLHASKPKPGCEKQFHRINEKLAALGEDEQRTDLQAALEQVAITPYEVIGAPRVGINDTATAWFRTQVFEPIQKRLTRETNPQFIAYWRRPFELVLQEARGKYVVELATEKEGIAAITGMMCSSLDFRGKVVSSSEALEEGLKNEAYDDHDAAACVDYADRLEAALRSVHDKHLDELIELRSAVKWLRYWGTRGFGYSAWY